jgi:hypothetical protein
MWSYTAKARIKAARVVSLVTRFSGRPDGMVGAGVEAPTVVVVPTPELEAVGPAVVADPCGLGPASVAAGVLGAAAAGVVFFDEPPHPVRSPATQSAEVAVTAMARVNVGCFIVLLSSALLDSSQREKVPEKG